MWCFHAATLLKSRAEARNASNGCLPQFYFFGEVDVGCVFDYLQLFMSFADFEVCGFYVREE